MLTLLTIANYVHLFIYRWGLTKILSSLGCQLVLQLFELEILTVLVMCKFFSDDHSHCKFMFATILSSESNILQFFSPHFGFSNLSTSSRMIPEPWRMDGPMRFHV